MLHGFKNGPSNCIGNILLRISWSEFSFHLVVRTLVFLHSSVMVWNILKYLLKPALLVLLLTFSGLKKMGVFSSSSRINTSDRKWHSLSNWFLCVVKDWPLDIYVSLGKNPKTDSFWVPVIKTRDWMVGSQEDNWVKLLKYVLKALLCVIRVFSESESELWV